MGIGLIVLEATQILRRVVDNAGAVTGFVMYTEPKIIEENKWQLCCYAHIGNPIYPGIVRLLAQVRITVAAFSVHVTVAMHLYPNHIKYDEACSS